MYTSDSPIKKAKKRRENPVNLEFAAPTLYGISPNKCISYSLNIGFKSKDIAGTNPKDGQYLTDINKRSVRQQHIITTALSQELAPKHKIMNTHAITVLNTTSSMPVFLHVEIYAYTC